MPDGFWRMPIDVYDALAVLGGMMSSVFTALQIMRVIQQRPKVGASIVPKRDPFGRVIALVVTITNGGRRPVTITDIGFRSRTTKRIRSAYGTPPSFYLRDNESVIEEVSLGRVPVAERANNDRLCLEVNGHRVRSVPLDDIFAQSLPRKLDGSTDAQGS